MASFSVLLFLLEVVFVLGSSNYQDLLDVDSEFYLRPDFSFLPPPRTTRQTAGTTAICVPAGTCLSAGGTGGGIDPRIVTPGATVPPTTSCPPGQVSCVGSASAVACGQRLVPNVNNANGPAPPSSYPWQAFLRNETAYTGSGVLLDSLHVLTAAHKVNLNANTPGNLQVYMGVHDPMNLGQAQMRTVARVMLHPSFNTATLVNDIAVLRLSAPINLGYQNNIATACLPAASASYVGQSCTVSGWGRTAFSANDAPTSPQRQINVPIVAYATCRASMMQPNILGTNTDTYLDPNGELCAGGEANIDACTQDGGAPLVCPDASGRYNVAGLVIWGKNCGQPGVYGVYVDVAKYRAWIDSTIATLNIG